jgi:3-oxoacyl-[acyl-carrier protein] reductase
MISFSGKKILVTGGTRGIGKAIVNEFQELSGDVISVGSSDCDFSSSSEVNSFLSKLEDVDICVNCAGINKVNSLNNIHEEDFDRVLQINLKAPFLISRHVSKSMKNRGWGRIVNISSIWGTKSKAKRTSYSTSKSALIGMTRPMAIELAPYNVLVNSVSPGFTNTDLTRNILSDKKVLEEILEKIPLGRMAEPEEISRLVVFLCSDLNTYITGQDILIDGGFTIT